ncbi:hypothetical protein PSECIP111951_03475 [Pseudoalteromonas holothuriae]|uniref:Uncharacterized protein n=1 Tax=Pseudoalteromonas holothuriae TaxID=2963714 RepID=A0A9W4QZ06_9GAMM|nr:MULTISPECIES: hypothetical protein [unclassified Pseudoalteromonas]CAH9060392.1 hypothetical protein PSECIP111854_02596 [Pseudoalteromonas sp. CIP111854]CAH9065970.1 hypothetical protein PSECIP111951_03475 [Pseudoalteromonas sp. CIP111951]
MQPIVIFIVLMVVAIALAVGMIVQGHGCNRLELFIRRGFVKGEVEEQVPEKIQHTAYYLMLELGDLLESDKDMEQYYGVKTVFNHVSALRAETLGCCVQAPIIPMRPEVQSSFLKVIK